MKLNPRLTNDCSGVIPLYVPCLKCMTLAYLYDTNIHNKKSTHTYLVLNQTHNFSLTIRGGQLVELLYKRSSKESNLKQVCSDLEVVKLCENGWYLFKILMITMLSILLTDSVFFSRGSDLTTTNVCPLVRYQFVKLYRIDYNSL